MRFAAGSVLVLLAFMQLAQLSVAFGTPSQGVNSLPPASDSSTCFQNLNKAISQLSPIASAQIAQMLGVAESSAQYKAFASATGATPTSVDSSPALEYQTLPGCSGFAVDAYTFSFVSEGEELSVAVNPGTMTVLRTLSVPEVSWGVALNNSVGPWGGGYAYWNGSTYSNPTYPWYYIEGDWSIPSMSSSCSSICIYGIWSGLTDAYQASNYIAQTGVAGKTQSGHTTSYYLWYQFYPGNPHDCTFTVNSGQTVLAASYSDAWASSGGSASNYNEDSYDSAVGQGCATSSSYNWSSGLGTNSKFAVLTGETQQSTIPNFGQVTITGTIYDNHYNGGPAGHCTSTPYSNGDAESFYYSSGGHIATESLDNGHCAFNDDYW